MITIVVDTSVFLHQLYRVIMPIPHTDPRWKPLIKAQLCYLMSGNWLSVLKPEKFQIVLAGDKKDLSLKYWRHHWLASAEVAAQVPRKSKAAEKQRLKLRELMAESPLELSDEAAKLAEELAIHYKAGRRLPEYDFTKLKGFVYSCIEQQGWLFFRQTGYEADDIAATIVHINRSLEKPNKLMLVTVDTDWLGLVDEHTSWFCMHGYQPRLRDSLEVINQWAQRRLGCTLSNPRDIWEIKARQGDKSDNIPESDGALLPAIDLLNPPEEHRLWNQPIGLAIKAALEYPRYWQIDSDEAEEYIYRCGIPLAIRPLERSRDLPD